MLYSCYNYIMCIMHLFYYEFMTFLKTKNHPNVSQLVLQFLCRCVMDRAIIPIHSISPRADNSICALVN